MMFRNRPKRILSEFLIRGGPIGSIQRTRHKSSTDDTDEFDLVGQGVFRRYDSVKKVRERLRL
jgi:hypothetical protein